MTTLHLKNFNFWHNHRSLDVSGYAHRCDAYSRAAFVKLFSDMFIAYLRVTLTDVNIIMNET